VHAVDFIILQAGAVKSNSTRLRILSLKPGPIKFFSRWIHTEVLK
jgi:hypothetical protein